MENKSFGFSRNLYKGDCFQLMDRLPDACVDLVLTDPPYGATNCVWDKCPDLAELWTHLRRVGKSTCVFVFTAIQPFTTDLINSNRNNFKHEWVWVKNTSTGMMLVGKAPMRRHENVVVFGNGKKSTFNPQKVMGSATSQNHSKRGYSYTNKDSKLYDVAGGVPFVWSEYVNPHSVLPCNSVGNRDKTKVHPTQKPTALLEYLIKTYSNPHDFVLDPFAGSGSTGVACINTDREFLLFEQEKPYFLAARTRLREAKAARNNR